MHVGASLHAGVIGALRADLSDAGYTVDGVRRALGEVAAAALHREQTVPADRATNAPGATRTLVRLFTLGHEVPAARVAAAVPRCGIDGLVTLGLVRATGEAGQHVAARVDLRPYGDERHDWWVASDLSEIATGQVLAADHVLGIGGASTTLASWTPRRSAGSALDLGTGCGVQALHLSGHCDRIMATDLSARALGFARFNAALNGLDLELRTGSMLEPVAGQAFDLIVSNPPFVITPRTPSMPEFEYRDGLLVGDELVRRLVADVAAHLRPGGLAQFLGNWEVPGGSSWRQVVGRWVAGTGLDAWVVQRDVQDPAEYAELWAADGGHRRGRDAYEQMYAAWLDDFASRDVESIGFGVITLQRPSTAREPFVDLMEADGPVAAPMGPSIDAGLAARTWLAEHGDAGVLDSAWMVAPDVTEERHGRPGADDPNVIQLRQGGGLRRVIRADTALAALMSVCDGELTARAALSAIAALLDADEGALIDQTLPAVRELVADGLLTR